MNICVYIYIWNPIPYHINLCRRIIFILYPTCDGVVEAIYCTAMEVTNEDFVMKCIRDILWQIKPEAALSSTSLLDST